MREYQSIERTRREDYVSNVKCDACGKSCKMAGVMGMETYGLLKYCKQGDAGMTRMLDLCADCVNTALDTLGLHFDVPVQEPITVKQSLARKKRREKAGQFYFGP
jgi:hypothetical protein